MGCHNTYTLVFSLHSAQENTSHAQENTSHAREYLPDCVHPADTLYDNCSNLG